MAIVMGGPFVGLTPPYATIVADPPWRYSSGTERRNSAGTLTGVAYSTMSAQEVADLPVAALAADDAHLYLWTTNTKIFETLLLEIVAAWGFTYKTMLTWIKTGQPGLGSYFRGCTEHVLFCTKGAASIPPAVRERNHFAAHRTPHSTKPDAFFDLVERVSPAPRVELFARAPRLGWDHWGKGYEVAS